MSEKKIIKLKIATQERLVEERDIVKITIPTTSGVITILPDHVPLISTLNPGILEVTMEGNKNEELVVSGGFLEFHDNELTVLADTAERAHELDLERAEEARKRASEAKQAKRKAADENQFAAIISQLEKQNARVKLAKKYRGKSKRMQ
jgi:F-type H+-transporting ATPase subunit epsilon